MLLPAASEALVADVSMSLWDIFPVNLKGPYEIVSECTLDFYMPPQTCPVTSSVTVYSMEIGTG